MSSTPFSSELFAAEALEDLQTQALHQAKAAISLLEFKPSGKRPSSEYSSRFNKRARGSSYTSRFPYYRNTQRSRSKSRSPPCQGYRSPYRGGRGTPGRSYFWSPGRYNRTPGRNSPYQGRQDQYRQSERQFENYPKTPNRNSGRSSPRGRGRSYSGSRVEEGNPKTPGRGRRQF